MQYQYKNIASLICIHDFFGERAYHYAQFKPTQATLKILGNHRILYKAKEGAFDLLCETNIAEELLSTPLSLFFTLTFSDPYWSNYTDLEQNPVGKIYYAGTTSYNSSLTKPGEYLSNDVTVVAYDGLPVPRTELNELPAENVITGEIQNCPLTVKSESMAWVNLTALHEGLYTLKANPEIKFVKTADDISTTTILCHIVIDVAALHQQQLTMTVRLKSTEVLLKYYVPKDAFKNVSDLIIVNDREENVFAPMKESMLAKKSMLSFTSLKKYNYRNQMKESLHLKRKNGIGNGIAIFKNLPLPSRENLCKRDDDGNKFVELFLKM